MGLQGRMGPYGHDTTLEVGPISNDAIRPSRPKQTRGDPKFTATVLGESSRVELRWSARSSVGSVARCHRPGGGLVVMVVMVVVVVVGGGDEGGDEGGDAGGDAGDAGDGGGDRGGDRGGDGRGEPHQLDTHDHVTPHADSPALTSADSRADSRGGLGLKAFSGQTTKNKYLRLRCQRQHLGALRHRE